MYRPQHILSKSTFLYGCQCPKRLYLYKFRKDLRPPQDAKLDAIMQAGTSFGELARQLFPGGVDASPPDYYSYDVSVQLTASLIAGGETTIYEAAFQYDGVLCALDILVKRGKHWYAFEVKSTLSIKEQHILDVAFQYYVLTNCGIQLEDISLICFNREYIKIGNLDVQQLFKTTSVLNEVQEKQSFIRTNIRHLKEMLIRREEPRVDIGPHCLAPYACEFMKHCWSHLPEEGSIFELSSRSVWKLYQEGFRRLEDIPTGYPLGASDTLHLSSLKNGQMFIDREPLYKFIGTLKFPLYFFDFETIMPGIPEFDHTHPYQQIPFQFSLHIQREPGGASYHHEWLGDGFTDPRRELVSEMMRLLGNTGSIVCYNMSFEKSRIRELAELCPDYNTPLGQLNERAVDLMIPFRSKWIYHPRFHGSYSIKDILPVLVPQLSYDDLEISDGGTASLIYSQLKFQEPTIAHQQRQDLLRYCHLDTLGMVELLKAILHILQEDRSQTSS